MAASNAGATIETIAKLSSKISGVAASFTLLLFVAANGFGYLAMQAHLRQIFDGYAECGFPLSFYGEGGFAPVSHVLWFGLVADYLVALLVSVVAGVAWKRVKQKKGDSLRLRARRRPLRQQFAVNALGLLDHALLAELT